MSKLKTERDSFQAMNEQQLKEKVGELRRELFATRLNTITGQTNNYAQVKTLKSSVARAMTILREKELQASK